MQSGWMGALPDNDAGQDGDHGKHAGGECQQQAETKKSGCNQPQFAALQQGRHGVLVWYGCRRHGLAGWRQHNFQRFLDRRVTQAFFAASLIACQQGHGGRRRGGVPKSDDGVDAAVEHLAIAEPGIMLGFAPRQIHADYAAGRPLIELETDTVAVQVMAGCDGEGSAQRLPVFGSYSQFECLVRLQNPAVGRISKQAAQAAAGGAVGKRGCGDQAKEQEQVA
ncbi:hypothetical protein GALL_340590 [mine drainage metagenome]|uniref:Uncharacterized protein n=1 Tax=mine drainage metagenome TaxID=410659 RepID=A0A1J5R303_9ZZZZ